MKKFIVLSIMFAALLSVSFTNVAKAQTSFNHTIFNANGTITNTSSDTMTVQVLRESKNHGIQIVFNKTSGIVGGNSVLYGSIDGVNFVPTGDTLKMTDLPVNTAIFNKAAPVYLNYQVITTGTGTMVGIVNAKVVTRSPI